MLKQYLLFFVLSTAALHAAEEPELFITAIAHNTERYGYTITTPEQSNSNCNVYGDNVSCHSTTYGGQTYNKAVYYMTQIVEANGQRYTLQRTARWVWQNTDFLTDGDNYAARIKGHHMYISARKGGNQGRVETIKYQIMDIRGIRTASAVAAPAPPPPPPTAVTPAAQPVHIAPAVAADPGHWIYNGFSSKSDAGLTCQYISSKANDGRTFTKTVDLSSSCPFHVPMTD